MPKRNGIHIHRIDENGTPDYEFIARDDCPGLKEFYEMIDCKMIEIVPCPDGKIMVVDEEGLLKANPQPNIPASIIAKRHIVGTAVVLDGIKFD